MQNNLSIFCIIIIVEIIALNSDIYRSIVTSIFLPMKILYKILTFIKFFYLVFLPFSYDTVNFLFPFPKALTSFYHPPIMR